MSLGPPAPGEVVLVGGGPGDPDLLTLAGVRALRAADVVLFDHLAPAASLAECRPGAALIDVGKLPRGAHTPQAHINDLLVENALSGRRVVRFKGGDPFVLGRGWEEVQACAAAGVPVRVIPGVSSAVAGPALAGIPLTHRGLAQGFTVVSGHVGPDHPGSATDWDAVARLAGTIVVLMGVGHLHAICAGLIERGMTPGRPAALVERASTPEQRVLRGTLASLSDLAAGADARSPALVVIGEVVALGSRGPSAPDVP